MISKSRKSKGPKKTPTGDYIVGYAKTPEGTRFAAGQSGNPNGRPRLALNDFGEMFLQEFSRKFKIRSGDKVEKLPIMQLMLRQLANQSAKGDPKAMALAIQHLKALAAIQQSDNFAHIAQMTNEERARRITELLSIAKRRMDAAKPRTINHPRSTKNGPLDG